MASKNSNTNQYLDRRQEDPSEDESAESDDEEDNEEDNKEGKAQEGAVAKATESEFIFLHYSDSLLSYPFRITLKTCMQIILGLCGKRREKPWPYICFRRNYARPKFAQASRSSPRSHFQLDVPSQREEDF